MVFERVDESKSGLIERQMNGYYNKLGKKNN